MSTPNRIGLCLLALALTTTWLAAQPRKEEEEEPPAKEKAKEKARPVVPVPVGPDKKDAAPPAADPVDPDVGTFTDEIKRATIPAAKEMYRAVRLPFDRIEPNFGTGGLRYKIELLPERDLPEGEFTYNVLDPTLTKVVETHMSPPGPGSSTPRTSSSSSSRWTSSWARS